MKKVVRTIILTNLGHFLLKEKIIGYEFTVFKERPLKIIGESKKLLVARPIEPDFKSSS